MACNVESEISIIIFLIIIIFRGTGVRGGNRGEHTFDVIIVTVMHIDFALPGSWDFLRRAAHAQALQGQSRLPSVTFSGSLRASRVCCIVRACAV